MVLKDLICEFSLFLAFEVFDKISAKIGVHRWADGKEIDPEATLTVKVVSAGKEETVYNEKHRKDSESISFSITGVGTITVKVFVNDVKKAEKQMNLNSSETFWKVE